MREYSTTFDAARLSCSDAAIVVDEAAALEHMAATVKAFAAARAAEGHSWKRHGYRSPEEELARQTGTSVNSAREALTLGKRLGDQPQVADAARQGVISPTQASTIADAVGADPTSAEQLLEAAAAGGSLADLKNQAAEVKARVIDLERRRQNIHRRRFLRQWTNPDGEWHTHAMGNPEDGAQIMAYVEAIANECFERARKDGRQETREAYRFDAFVGLARAAGAKSNETENENGRGHGRSANPAADSDLGSDPDHDNGREPGTSPDPGLGANPGAGPDPGICADRSSEPGPSVTDGSPPSRRQRRRDQRHRRGAPVKLLIRVDLDTLLRGFPCEGEVCDLVGYGPVSVGAVHKLLEDGDPFVAAILTKGERLLGVAHLGRKPTSYQRSFLEWLYPTCAAQGCPAPAQHLQIDHRHDWTATHVTLIDWLDGLCPHHHLQKTRYGWCLVEGLGKRPFVPPNDPRHPKNRPPPGGAP